MPRAASSLADTACRVGIDRAHVDDDQARASAGSDAVVAQGDGMHVRGVGDHREHDLGVLRHFGGRGMRPGIDRLERIEGVRAPRPEMEGVAGLGQVQGQWPAHEAETDEADMHWKVSSDGRVGRALRGARPAG